MRKLSFRGLKSFLITALSILAFIFPVAAAEKVVLQLAWDHQFQFAGYYAAQWQGYYADAGYDVELRSRIRPDGTFYDVVREVEEGRADFGIGSGNILVAKDKGASLMLLAPIFQQSAVALFAKKSDRLNSPADLTRLKVAINPRGLARAEIFSMLHAEDIDPADIDIIHKRGGIQILAKGQADVVIGYIIEAEWLAKEKGLTLTSLRPATYGVDFYGDSLFSRRDRTLNDPDGVSRFVAATLKGWEYALAHPEEIADRISSDLPRHFAVSDLKGFNRIQIGPIKQLTHAPVIQLGHINPERWRRMYDLLKQSNSIKASFDPNDLIFDPELLERQRQDRLTLRILYGLAVLFLIAGFAGFWLLLKLNQDRRRSEMRFRRYFELPVIGSAIYTLDKKWISVNDTFCDLLGYSREELLEVTWADTTHPDDLEENLRLFEASLSGIGPDAYSMDKRFIRKDGSVIHTSICAQCVRTLGGAPDYFILLVQDITERKQSEDKIKASLEEKEVLLREIHHRVKNNLQVISAMLWLQANADDDAHTVEVLQDSRRRVMLMAQIHESLHRQDNLTVINAKDLLSTLVDNTKASGGAVTENLCFDIDIDDISLDVDQANSYGQIISELISNAMKHGFTYGQPGNVEVSLRRGDCGVTELTVADDGEGLPEHIDLQQTKTLGLQLVHSLAEKLDGDIHIDRSGGTRIQINFPENPS